MGNALLSLIGFDLADNAGVKKEYVVGHVINNHDPPSDLDSAEVSSTIFVRQDPFKATVYIQRYNLLFMLAQLVGAMTVLNFIGFVLTSFWTNRLYNASMIKHLYKVKHTSAGRDLKPAPMSKHSPTQENKANTENSNSNSN